MTVPPPLSAPHGPPIGEDPLAHFASGKGRHVYLPVDEVSFKDAVSSLSRPDVALIDLFCAENFEGHKGFTLFYVFEKRGAANLLILRRPLRSDTATSIAEAFPSACWFERKVTDGFGVEFNNAFDKRRLFLHEMYPDGFHPMLKSFKNQPVQTRQTVPPEEEYRFKELTGEGVYQIPVGPVHAGIIEPGHFRFSVIGETIFNLEIRMFYKHRGIEKLAEGKPAAQCVGIAETISGDETVANATAFCMAVEKLSGSGVPDRAWQLRTVLLEMERVYSHLGDMAGMILDVAFPVGASHFFVMREEVFRQNEAMTGSRFMKGMLCPGGLKKDVPAEALSGLATYLGSLAVKLDDAMRLIRASTSVIDRLATTGRINKEIINPLNITGPAARASGVAIDTRLDHPYGRYALLSALEPRTREDGDVLGRFELKAQEINDSIKLVQRTLSGLRTGAVNAPVPGKDGYALAIVEAPMGQSLHWVYIRGGVIDRYEVRTASFCNWQAIEHAVLGNIVPDFPLINKSLNLSYAGTDL